jgi:DNA-directed RNA polymerase III subunit RPC8
MNIVEFRLVMFRPFKGEIIMGKISSSGEWGIKGSLTLHAMPCSPNLVRLDFFEDIHVPPSMLFEGSKLYDILEYCA